jgi:hypothetical protein
VGAGLSRLRLWQSQGDGNGVPLLMGLTFSAAPLFRFPIIRRIKASYHSGTARPNRPLSPSLHRAHKSETADATENYFFNSPCIWSQSAKRSAHVSQGRFCLFMPKPCPPFAYT